jgi:hypothetical protein
MRQILSVAILFIFFNNVSAQNFSEILGRPTESSVTISILFDQSVDVFWEIGTQSGIYPATYATKQALKDSTIEFDFTGLLPNTQYFYRTRYRLSGNSNAFSSGSEHRFYTQRATGTTFTFTVESDEHLYDASQGSPNLYKINLANQQKDSGDFVISLGDIFGDDHTPATTTAAQMKAKHLYYRQFLGTLCHSSPFFVCLGNHEGENDYLLNQSPPNNIAIFATLWRKVYFPNPYPNTFYTGNTNTEGFGIGLPENYYAWIWGDALFVVLDGYRDQCDTSANPKKWDWTLGLPQYTWFKNVLETSKAKYKFVFAHHTNGQSRGLASAAKLYEWGGNEISPSGVLTNKFSNFRPGWSKPVHQLMVDNKVNIFFQGHDHLFAKEELDGIIYQEVPMAADSTYQMGIRDWGSFYNQNVVDGSGHLRVNVSPTCIKVDYVKAYLPKDTLGANKNRQIGFSYTTGNCTTVTGINSNMMQTGVKVYPNPVGKTLFINESQIRLYDRAIELYAIDGKKMLQSLIPAGQQQMVIDVSYFQAGMYLMRIKDGIMYTMSKFMVVK